MSATSTSKYRYKTRRNNAFVGLTKGFELRITKNRKERKIFTFYMRVQAEFL